MSTVRQVRSLRADGEPVSDLMRTFGVSRATVYRALQQVDQGEPVIQMQLPNVNAACVRTELEPA
jgi:DNA invertase Pin-like site-specific DNA recombinase